MQDSATLHGTKQQRGQAEEVGFIDSEVLNKTKIMKNKSVGHFKVTFFVRHRVQGGRNNIKMTDWLKSGSFRLLFLYKI
jgi:hypothetical protein